MMWAASHVTSKQRTTVPHRHHTHNDGAQKSAAHSHTHRHAMCVRPVSRRRARITSAPISHAKARDAGGSHISGAQGTVTRKPTRLPDSWHNLRIDTGAPRDSVAVGNAIHAATEAQGFRAAVPVYIVPRHCIQTEHRQPNGRRRRKGRNSHARKGAASTSASTLRPAGDASHTLTRGKKGDATDSAWRLLLDPK